MAMGAGLAMQAGASAISLAEGEVQFVSSLIKGKKDKEELARLKQPFYKIQNEYVENRNLAAQMATGGLPDATKNMMLTETQRGLGASLGAMKQTGGGINDMARLNSIIGDSINTIGAEDANARIKNIQYYMGVNKDLAGQKTMKWSLDEYQPYERKLKELTERRAADEKNAYNGANQISGSLSNLGTAMDNNQLMQGNNTAIYNKLFNGVGDPIDMSMNRSLPDAGEITPTPMSNIPYSHITG